MDNKALSSAYSKALELVRLNLKLFKTKKIRFEEINQEFKRSWFNHTASDNDKLNSERNKIFGDLWSIAKMDSDQNLVLMDPETIIRLSVCDTFPPPATGSKVQLDQWEDAREELTLFAQKSFLKLVARKGLENL